jgi:predicted O-methyltransferase YrrM
VKNRVIQILHEKTHPNDPWLTRQSVHILADLLQDTDTGLEFGSGRSTIWFAQRTSRVISIEHDFKWYQSVGQKIQDLNLESKIDYRYCDNIADYVGQIDSLEDNSIDYCLIDGKARDECTLKVLPKLKHEGILIIDNINLYLPNASRSPNSIRRFDNTNDSDWASVQVQIDSWEMVWTTNGVSDTALWIKP